MEWSTQIIHIPSEFQDCHLQNVTDELLCRSQAGMQGEDTLQTHTPEELVLKKW